MQKRPRENRKLQRSPEDLFANTPTSAPCGRRRRRRRREKRRNHRTKTRRSTLAVTAALWTSIRTRRRRRSCLLWGSSAGERPELVRVATPPKPIDGVDGKQRRRPSASTAPTSEKPAPGVCQRKASPAPVQNLRSSVTTMEESRPRRRNPRTKSTKGSAPPPHQPPRNLRPMDPPDPWAHTASSSPTTPREAPPRWGMNGDTFIPPDGASTTTTPPADRLTLLSTRPTHRSAVPPLSRRRNGGRRGREPAVRPAEGRGKLGSSGSPLTGTVAG
jgi:hypothetical protein